MIRSSKLYFYVKILSLDFIKCIINLQEDGTYEFTNVRENWPTCLEDIQCDIPPPVPTNEEYTLKKVRKYMYTIIIKAKLIY